MIKNGVKIIEFRQISPFSIKTFITPNTNKKKSIKRFDETNTAYENFFNVYGVAKRRHFCQKMAETPSTKHFPFIYTLCMKFMEIVLFRNKRRYKKFRFISKNAFNASRRFIYVPLLIFVKKEIPNFGR